MHDLEVLGEQEHRAEHADVKLSPITLATEKPRDANSRSGSTA